MKVWELMNKIKRANSSKDTILNWMLMNKICPTQVMFELDEEYNPALMKTAIKHCDEFNECSGACYEAFLEKEVENETNQPA